MRDILLKDFEAVGSGHEVLRFWIRSVAWYDARFYDLH